MWQIFHIFTSNDIDDIKSHFYLFVYANSGKCKFSSIRKKENCMVAWRYELYFLVIFYQLKIHILKQPCNILCLLDKLQVVPRIVLYSICTTGLA